MTATANATEYRQSVVDDLDQEISIALGIDAGMAGLECLDKGMLDGVRQIQALHIDRLQAIRERVAAEKSKG